MSAFTNLTADLWNWSPWLRLEHGADDVIGRCSKLFWLGLYTTNDAKRCPPGLFTGSLTHMSDVVRMPVDACVRYLDRLLEHDLVEYDRENRVLRMTQLPGFGDAYNCNAKVLRGWWTSFNKITGCDVRDAHVTTIKWMIDEWRKFKGEPLTPEQSKAWAETFARVSIPPQRRRGVRRFADSDTSTSVQPSLFTLSEASSSVDKKPVGFGSGYCSETVPEQLNNSPDQDPDPEPDPDFLGSKAEAESRPRLVLVPPPPPDEVTQLLTDLATGHGLDVRHAAVREGTLDGLCRTIAEFRAAEATAEERIACGEWARGTCALGRVSGDPTSKLSAWASIPGMLLATLNAVRTRARQRAEVQDQLAAINGGH